MAPAVPFAALGVIELLSVAGWLALAGAALFPAMWRRATPAFVAGAGLLAATDVATVIRFGAASSRLLAELRFAGLVLTALAVASGVFQGRSGRASRRPPGRPSGVSGPPGSGLGVSGLVVPLGAPLGWGLASAAVGLLAAGAALRSGHRRGPEGDRPVSLALGLVFLAAGLAGAVSPAAGRNYSAAVAVLALQALSAAAALVVCARLAARSVLAKVVAAILVGVIVMAAGAVGVVGASVGSAVLADQVRATSQAAHAEQQALATASDEAELRAQFVVACVARRVDCTSLLDAFSDTPGPFFAAQVCAVADPATGCLPGRPLQVAGTPIAPAALGTLASEAPVLQALAAHGECAGVTIPLGTSPPTLAVVGIVPSGLTTAGCAQPTLGPSSAAGLYGVLYTDSTANSLAQAGYAVSFLSGGEVLASSLPPAQRAALSSAADALGARALPAGGLTVVSQGSSPTISVTPIVDSFDGVQVAELAVSAPAARVVGPERSVLTRLFLTTLAALVVVAGLALLLGGRIVDPVRRLTHAVRQVRRGELDAVAPSRGRDEVATLSRSFNAMTGSLRDMTARLRSAAEAEAALRQRLQTVVDSMADGLLTTDDSGLITGVNPVAAELLGGEGSRFVGRALTDVVQLRDGAAEPVRWGAAGESAEGLLGRPSGSVPVQVSVTPLGGDPAGGLVVLLRDMTRDREVERMKTEFLANVSHELRTPLTPIRGYAELLSRAGPRSANAERYVRAINEASIRMQRVVELLVDVAALEAGRVEPARRATPVGPFVEECLERWRRRWPDRAGDLRRRVASRLPSVDIDPQWVGKALDELVDNAMKYTVAPSPVTIAASLGPEGKVRLAVRDAGPGLPGEDLPALLGDFAQADASETRKVGGMGLGLAFVRRLAEGFGIALHVRSEPGRGAEFALDLPVAEPVAKLPGQTRAAQRRGGRLARLGGS